MTRRCRMQRGKQHKKLKLSHHWSQLVMSHRRYLQSPVGEWLLMQRKYKVKEMTLQRTFPTRRAGRWTLIPTEVINQNQSKTWVFQQAKMMQPLKTQRIALWTLQMQSNKSPSLSPLQMKGTTLEMHCNTLLYQVLMEKEQVRMKVHSRLMCLSQPRKKQRQPVHHLKNQRSR